ncbi:sigma 54-interacting transcriptional regulator [Tunicatimonas pelagia]|uniref:sigma 54-interacting transcriptional regulator n=1 Tax=Tunicatimonas pelagia TaxID=931531 RepID=UPI002665A902|nr:sigma 54-interacting transcriptional regulator [Tunicatimonas pelagia]WKN42760.1 sigma 54-interacting transcriptional regulator [Tunicatimonas pelagia]
MPLESTLDEKDTLLRLSTHLVKTRTRTDLLKALFEEVKSIFPFEHAGLFVVDAKKDIFYELLGEGTLDELQDRAAQSNLLGPWPYSGNDPQSWIYATQPTIFDVEDQSMIYANPQWKGIKAEGLQQFIGGPLMFGDQTIGLLCFLHKSSDYYSEDHFPLFQAIADQLAVAVSNVLANEQLLEEKNFSNTLLKITEAVASVNNTQQLYRTIFDTIKPVFPFDELGLFALDDNGETHYELIDESVFDRSVSQKQVEEHLGKHALFPHKGSSVDWLMQNGPMSISIEQLDKNAPHPHHRYMMEGGLKSLIGGPLVSGGKVFGMLCFTSTEENFYTKKHTTFFKSIAEQISIAVANILANEQVLSEKQFKETLLGISEAVAHVQDRNKLLKLIFEKIKSIIPFYDAGLIIINEQEDWLEDLMVTNPDISPSEENKELNTNFNTNRKIAYHGSPINWLIGELKKQDGLLLIHYPKVKEQFPEWIHFKLIREFKHEYGLYALLKIGNQVLGSVNINSIEKNTFDARNFALFRAIADQLAVAVSNVLANEQVLEEKQKTENLLKITESIANINTGPELVRAIFDRLQQVFPFSDAGLFHLDLDRQMERDLVVDYSYDIGINAALKEERLGGWMPITGASKHIIDHKLIVMGADIYEKLDHPHFQNPEIRNFKSVIGAALNHGGQTIGLLYFWSKTEYFFDQSLPQFKSICDQLSVALNNIIANEQLVEEKQFKETLLGISEAVAAIKDRKDLFRTIVKSIKPVFPFDDLGVFVYDETQQYQRDLAVDERFGIFLDYHVEGWLERNAGVDNFIEKGPLIKSLHALMDEYPGHPHYAKLEKEGLTHIIGGPLKQGGEAIGMLCFWSQQEDFYTEKDFSLFQAIAEQLSVAVSNVLANEEIAQRNLEKSVQISLIDSLNKETKWEARQRKFAQAIEKLFPADFIGFYYDKEGMTEISTGFEKIGFNEYRKVTLLDFLRMSQLDLSVFNRVLKEEEDHLPFILEIRKEAEAGRYLNPIRKGSLEKLHLNSVLALSMRVKDHPFYIYLNSKKSEVYHYSHIEMFKRIAPSFAQSLEKSMDYEELLSLNKLLKEEKAYLTEEVAQQYNFSEMIGSSAVMQQVFEKVKIVMNSDTTVLILGETGTGKELIARALHNASERKSKPLIKVNCAALPRELVESELFGHEKGAFTGATSRRIGKFELAHEGTLFLDEIGELPIELQAKLLRAIQEKEFERLGGNKTIRINTRIIAATNRDLEHEVKEGNFRSDLFFRLSIFPIELPPLRERGEDIPALARYFLEKYENKTGKRLTGMAKAAENLLNNYPWPGNVRELEHVIERSVLLSQAGKPLQLALENARPASAKDKRTFEFKTLQAAETELIFETLKRCQGKISGKHGAAEMLGIPPSTLEYRMRRAGITKQMVIEKL